MGWLAPSLPLRKSTETGYVLVKDYTKLVKQNFKNLLLTIPGERMMDPNFGIGIKRFLFEIDSPLLYDRISSKVRQQVNRYLPYLDIENIIFNSATEDPTMDLNSLGVIIEYRIVPLELSDQLEITTIVD
jgi:phage baseplate assembly protein W